MSHDLTDHLLKTLDSIEQRPGMYGHNCCVETLYLMTLRFYCKAVGFTGSEPCFSAFTCTELGQESCLALSARLDDMGQPERLIPILQKYRSLLIDYSKKDSAPIT